MFSTYAYTNDGGNNPAPINNFADIYTNQVITDTTNWTTISGSFIADSVYNYISIGCFFDSLHTIVIDYYHDFPYTSAAYYFIDDIRVSTDSAYGLGIEVKQIIKKTFSVYPNPSTGIIKIKPPDNDAYIMELYDVLGNKLNNSLLLLPEGGEAKQLDVSYLSDGTYFITLRNTNTVLSNKVIITKNK